MESNGGAAAAADDDGWEQPLRPGGGGRRAQRQGAAATTTAPRRRHRVLMATDFFYPNFGGVENHVYQLSQRLLGAGHKVVVLTHAYGGCAGARWLAGGLKVYYAPRRPIHAQSTLPTVAGNLRLLRAILARERITLVHAHQAFSALGLEALIHARTMGLPAVFTDHSLFGFADAASIATNKMLKAALSDADAVICVSHTSRENTVLRACLPPSRVSVIPNGAAGRVGLRECVVRGALLVALLWCCLAMSCVALRQRLKLARNTQRTHPTSHRLPSRSRRRERV